MKDVGRTKFCFGLEIQHLKNGIFVHQEAYKNSFIQKAEGYKTIFKRREISCHAVKWLEKDNVRLFSHQIPARKLPDMEGDDLPGEC